MAPTTTPNSFNPQTSPNPGATPSGHDFFSEMFHKVYGLGQAAPIAGALGLGATAGASMAGAGAAPTATTAAPAAPATNPFAAMLAGLGGGAVGGAGAGAPAGPNIAGLLKQLQEDKDPVGRYDNRSNLPSNAPGSLSPFATGFFKPKSVAPSANSGAAAAGAALR